MQYDANSPIWLQVMNLIRMDIVTGKRAPGEKLPGGRDLAVQFSINPNTAAREFINRMKGLGISKEETVRLLETED